MQTALVLLTFLATAPSLAVEESGYLAYLGYALFLAGPIFFGLVYARYRNRSERHYHERETPVSVKSLQSYDNFDRHLTRQDSPRLAGANDSQVRGTLAQGAAPEAMLAELGKLLPPEVGKKPQKPK